MNKKLISALFVGALLLGSTSTLTSCKDYDDDINNLQEQIDKKALQSDVDALKTELSAAQATAAAAKTTAEQALASAKAANDAVALKAAQSDLDAAVARIKTLEDKMAALDQFEKDLKASVDSQIAAMKTEFATLKADIMNAIGSMITSVDLVASWTNGTVLDGDVPGLLTVNPTTGKVTTATVFGKANADKHIVGASTTQTYVKGTVFNFPAGFIARINPTNATIDASCLKLVNSKGENLNDYFTLTVEPYKGLITSRGISVGNGTGLYYVNVQLKEGVTAAQAAAVTVKVSGANPNYVLYALAVNNTEDATRSVVSTYDVALPEAADYVGDANLMGLKINDVLITNYHNRYSATENQSLGGSIFTAGSACLAGGVAIATPWDSWGNTADNRQYQKIYAFNIGQEIPIEFVDSKAEYFYVTLDTPNSIDSDNSEINAWNSYTYTGLNTITKVSEGGSIAVTAMGKTGDIIGFRVYAVNFDGTMVDPDGAAFYVYVGEKNNTGTAGGNFTPEVYQGYTALLPLTGTYSDNAVSNGALTFKNGVKGTWALMKDATHATNKWSEAKYILFTAANAAGSFAYNWEDGATSVATLEAANNTGAVINTVEVTATKVMPTTYPSTFSWKAGQLVNGVFTCLVDPIMTATDATTVGGGKTATTLPGTFPFEWATLAATGNVHGYKNLDNAINGLNDVNYSFSFADAKTNGDKVEALNITTTVPNQYPVTIEKKFVDGKEHATTISYVYPKLSSEDATNGKDWKVSVQNVSTKFTCVLEESLQTYAWNQAPKIMNANGTAVAYPAKDMNYVNYTTPMTTQYIAGQFLQASNSTSYGAAKFAKTLPEIVQYFSVKATLTSVENGQEDYFTVAYTPVEIVSNAGGVINPQIEVKADGTLAGVGTIDAFVFTPKSGTTPPTIDVPSKLNVTFTDVFGHGHKYSLDVLVKNK